MMPTANVTKDGQQCRLARDDTDGSV